MQDLGFNERGVLSRYADVEEAVTAGQEESSEDEDTVEMTDMSKD